MTENQSTGQLRSFSSVTVRIQTPPNIRVSPSKPIRTWYERYLLNIQPILSDPAIIQNGTDSSQTSPGTASHLPKETLDFAHRMFDAARTGNSELLLAAVDAGLPVDMMNDDGAPFSFSRDTYPVLTTIVRTQKSDQATPSSCSLPTPGITPSSNLYSPAKRTQTN